MVGHAVLRVVVGADLLAALGGADHAAALGGERRLLLLALDLEEARSQHLERLRLVLQLRALVLALDDHAARLVQDLDGAVRRVDALTAGAAARGDRDLEVLVVDVHLDVVGLGQHRHCRGRRVDPALRLGRWHALHPVDAALEAQLRVDLFAADEGDALLVAARRAEALAHHLDLPPLGLGVAGVHAEEVGREERRLFAPLPAPDLEDGVLLVVRVGGEEEELDGLL
jgi:hypothetical protein